MAKCFQIVGSLALSLLVGTTAHASCEEFKAKVESQLQAKGIQSYSLEIVSIGSPPIDATLIAPEMNKPADPGRVIGTCDQGSKQLIYRRR
ncbi:MAG: hypothetical protein RLZZ144_708 [Pseudomonadota bacterium]|jgi:hypothetical protein